MGVYIPNMKKPTDCIYCKLYTDECYDEELGIEFRCVVKDNQSDACPLVEMDDTEWEWCHDCKEYDQEVHCCHRWTKVIRQTVEDVKVNYTIVTCGECNRSGTDGENIFCMWLGALRRPTDFCSYGERRADEHTD